MLPEPQGAHPAPRPSELSEAASRGHWERPGRGRRLGVVAPLFCARSCQSLGIGDFADLDRLVDWCVEIGASVLQLLPLNDMGTGSSPYSALSAMALDPIYLSLPRMEPLVQDAAWARSLGSVRAELETAPRVRYQQVRQEKMRLLYQAFEHCRSDLAHSPELEIFREESPWLEGYLAFRVLKEKHGWRSWEEWSRGRSPEEWIALAGRTDEEALDFHRFLQWISREQLRGARRYADDRGVLLLGDIPILVARDSADVWEHTELFHLDSTAGAPPDMYAADGQNWGFPTYDWESIASRDYAWWRLRLAGLRDYFHLYRIDHVVGFFRIWTIPMGEETGRNGRFVPEDEARWGEHGWRLLSMMLEASPLLPLAEDLGAIPPVCRDTLRSMGIPGLKVARWEKRYHGDGSFIHPREYPFLSVATSSTHDSETLAGWWQAFPGERAQLHRELGLGDRPPAELDRELSRLLLGDLARSGSAFAILPIWDLLHGAPGYLDPDPQANRVNLPGVCSEQNWTYRLPFLMERLIGDAALNGELREVLAR